jgi:hypothetical protein
MLRRTAILALMIFTFGSIAGAQYGGLTGDSVVYMVTYNGSATFNFPALGTVNTAANLSGFKKTVLNTVPFSLSTPFPLVRQVLYMTNSETFQVGTDYENTVGLHRIFTYPVKLFEISGINTPFAGAVGEQSEFISWPLGIDVEGDIAIETLVVATWFPGPWPFIVLTNQRGSLGPPNLSGFQYLFTIPNAVQLPSVLPWVNASTMYPTANWQPGTDFKLLDADPNIGDTIRQMRIRAGARTPVFNTAGHTHFFVLSGSVTVTPAGGTPIVMNQYDYAFLPEGFSISVSNPATYTGPVSK